MHFGLHPVQYDTNTYSTVPKAYSGGRTVPGNVTQILECSPLQLLSASLQIAISAATFLAHLGKVRNQVFMVEYRGLPINRRNTIAGSLLP